MGGMAITPDNTIMALAEDFLSRRQYGIRFRNLETGSNAPLVIGRRRQARITNHVAHRVNVWLCGLIHPGQTITSGDKAMKRYLRWIVAAEFLFAAGNLHAVEVEVPGLLTDHTVSSIGHDFYRAFSDKWESDYTGNLTINERPSARWGSWITITVNQDVIFQTFLFPLKRDFEKTVVFALIQTEEALNRRQINQALLSTGDLAHDEF